MRLRLRQTSVGAALVIALALFATLIPMAFTFALEATRQLWRGGRRTFCWAPIAALGSCMIGFPFVVEALAFSRPAVISSFFAGLATSTLISAVVACQNSWRGCWVMRVRPKRRAQFRPAPVGLLSLEGGGR
jgi:hypothetical protein